MKSRASKAAAVAHYAVRVGRPPAPVIVPTWTECYDLVHGYPGAVYKKFSQRHEAEQFLRRGLPVPVPASPLRKRDRDTRDTTASPAAKRPRTEGQPSGHATTVECTRIELDAVTGHPLGRTTPENGSKGAYEGSHVATSGHSSPAESRSRADPDQIPEVQRPPQRPGLLRLEEAGGQASPEKAGPHQVPALEWPPGLIRPLIHDEVPAGARTHGAEVPGPLAPFEESIWCDGACAGNGTTRACAGVGVWFGRAGDARNLGVRWAPRLPALQPPTNQQAELVAAVLAMSRASRTVVRINVHTDSRYAISVAEGRFNLVGTRNAPLAEWLQTLMAARVARGQIVTWTWVKGHAGDANNEAADRLAAAGVEHALPVMHYPTLDPDM